MRLKKSIMLSTILLSTCISTQAQAAWYDNVWDWLEDNVAAPVVDASQVTLSWLDSHVIAPIEGLATDVDGYVSILEATMSDHGYLSTYGQAYIPATQDAGPNGTLNIITFNIKGFPEALNGISDNEAQELSQFIENWQADIIGLQENWVRTDAITSQLSLDNYPYRTQYWAGTPTTFGDGLLTLSRYSLDQDKVQYHEWNKCNGTLLEYLTGAVSSPDCATEKGFTISEIEIAKDFIIHFYNLHGNTGHNRANNQSDLNQVSEMIQAYSAGFPVIIVGDFNIYFEQNSDRAHQYQLMLDFKAQTGMTFTCEEEPVNGVIEGCDRIDYIGYRNNPKFEFSHTPLVDNRLDHNNISDHAPRIGQLHWVNTYAYKTPIEYPPVDLAISLKASSGKYFTAEGNGGSTVNANRDDQGSWESFNLRLEQARYFTGCIQSGDLVSIRTQDGYYFSAQTDGSLDADRTQLGNWETFSLINHDDNSGCLENNDRISFRSHHGQFIVGESDGDAHADRTDIGAWEIITINM
ncbi:endonuclease/exonuclease/phosphatase family protein [Shewanella surugensis]|uniref:Endonuclease/exonuclease/phosphatase family protein n=1 Tax=Shewanella surugensis TaxID=212020 RepID=A0ABT0LB68_9GAMM|nr:endonuclease/exonuclease/phosphatase family protein [Shewanella surugensis]MCL1124951.1 endonuclease/exonuclease/phosphatase family protein [Shewanella surugensis]